MFAATLGIVSASLTPFSSTAFIGVAALAMGVWFWKRKTSWLLLSLSAAFGVLQIWQSRESPSALLAEIATTPSNQVTAIGLVASPPRVIAKNRIRFDLRTEDLEIDGLPLKANVKIAVTVAGEAPRCGDRVKIRGLLEPIPAPRNPGSFDVRRMMALRGITCEMKTSAGEGYGILDRAAGFHLLRTAEACSKWMESTLREGISDDPVVCDLLVGMVLGATSDIPDSLQDQFRETGTFHLFSVSGLHVGMIAVIFWQALRMLGVSRRSAVFVIIPALFFYALITGWKPSSIRAAAMSAIFLVGMISWRQPMAINSLCAAGFLILVQSTNELFNPGFQLSFVVVAGILLFATPIRDRLRKKIQPDPFIPIPLWTRWQRWGHACGEGIADAVSVSLAAWIGSLPLTIYYFHMVSLSSLLANLIIIPLAFGIMATAVLALFGGLLSGAVAAVFNNANLALIKALILIVQAAAALPGSSLLFGTLDRAPAAITIFDFADGGAVAVETGHRLWLLDCGSARDFKNTLLPWMRERGRDSADGLILSHGDARRMGGAVDLLSSGRPPLIMDSPLGDRSRSRKQLHDWLQKSGIPKSIQFAGDEIEINHVAKWRVLHPSLGYRAGLADDKALVVRLDTLRTRILFLADSGPDTFRNLLENRTAELASDILVLGHHHSGIPPDAAFIDAVRPSVIVVSRRGGFLDNEPIDPEWVSMLHDRGISVFQQSETGALIIHVFRTGYEVEGFVNGQKYRK
jgi:ComEC/Rec2-related protein